MQERCSAALEQDPQGMRCVMHRVNPTQFLAVFALIRAKETREYSDVFKRFQPCYSIWHMHTKLSHVCGLRYSTKDMTVEKHGLVSQLLTCNWEALPGCARTPGEMDHIN
ncbi:hypothetical protein RRG08_028916 [Elysia crispata]|uniref:Uncharacterized protein n=1 Tax=Elysia crispata TaxID=231223 RepID=A0AAE1APZ7_9GAST|nr:hypothetical protein RRG08_028916 [Elysia crispata]